MRIPLRRGLRSLNVAQAGALVLGEALRQTKGFPSARTVFSMTVEDRKAAAPGWFAELARPHLRRLRSDRGRLYGARRGRRRAAFVRKDWKRPTADGSDGGGGTMAMMKGRVFEKVGVNISTVHGRFDPHFAKEIPGADSGPVLLGGRHFAGRPHA